MSGTSPKKCMLALTTPPHLYSWSTIKKDSGVIPKEGGLYAWYFDRFLTDVPKRGCFGISRRKLLYVGISPASEPSGGTLHSRILYHFRGNCSGSTLRTTLAVSCNSNCTTAYVAREVLVALG